MRDSGRPLAPAWEMVVRDVLVRRAQLETAHLLLPESSHCFRSVAKAVFGLSAASFHVYPSSLAQCLYRRYFASEPHVIPDPSAAARSALTATCRHAVNGQTEPGPSALPAIVRWLTVK